MLSTPPPPQGSVLCMRRSPEALFALLPGATCLHSSASLFLLRRAVCLVVMTCGWLSRLLGAFLSSALELTPEHLTSALLYPCLGCLGRSIISKSNRVSRSCCGLSLWQHETPPQVDHPVVLQVVMPSLCAAGSLVVQGNREQGFGVVLLKPLSEKW